MRARQFSDLPLLSLVISGIVTGVAGFDVLDYIDPLIGTVNGGKIPSRLLAL